MDEQDYKYLISSYQQKCFDFVSQIVAAEARVKKLTDIIESLNTKIVEQQEELNKLSSKTRKSTQRDDFV